jgi:uncharacterized membrane protein YozB (DUF420 family)
MGISDLATVNAALNATASVLIGSGFYFIKKKNIPAHKACMIAAMVVSAVFLTSYLILPLQSPQRAVYEAGLDSQCLLSSALDAYGFSRGCFADGIEDGLSGPQRTFGSHVRIARWSFPIWMYVSVTGVVVYLMPVPLIYSGWRRLQRKQSVEEELVGPVRLGARKGSPVRTAQAFPSPLSHPRRHLHSRALSAPKPNRCATARRNRTKQSYRRRLDAESRTSVKKEIGSFGHAEGQGF